jgi:2-keto-4-pentenoate hydratase/2-oxohepta-3-ene-1,7-dioic acid hydratase in catechol pathway
MPQNGQPHMGERLMRAITPDSLGKAWCDRRVCLDLAIDWNGQRFGTANGREMGFGFHELIAHAAATRDLVAGTIIGSGTVANTDYAKVGSSGISERRANGRQIAERRQPLRGDCADGGETLDNSAQVA